MRWSANSLTAIAIILVVAALCQLVASRLNVPSVLFLLVAGVSLSPVVDPDEILGDLLFTGVGLGVAVLLFEGGTGLHWDRLRQGKEPVLRLVTIGAVIAWAVGSTGRRHLPRRRDRAGGPGRCGPDRVGPDGGHAPAPGAATPPADVVDPALGGDPDRSGWRRHRHRRARRHHRPAIPRPHRSPGGDHLRRRSPGRRGRVVDPADRAPAAVGARPPPDPGHPGHAGRGLRGVERPAARGRPDRRHPPRHGLRQPASGPGGPHRRVQREPRLDHPRCPVHRARGPGRPRRHRRVPPGQPGHHRRPGPHRPPGLGHGLDHRHRAELARPLVPDDPGPPGGGGGGRRLPVRPGAGGPRRSTPGRWSRWCSPSWSARWS